MRAVVISDSENWILGEIGRKWDALAGEDLEIEHLVQERPRFTRSLAIAQKRADVVHFLSHWDFKRYYRMVWRPCSVTIWHMVNWENVENLQGKWDLVTTGSEQWRHNISEHFKDEPSILRIPFGLDTQEFQPVAGAREIFLTAAGRSLDTILIGVAGKKTSNERERKGLDRLFAITYALRTVLDQPFLVRIIGKEWRVEDIPSDLRDVIQLEGFIAKAELPHFYAEIDYYICTSRVEGVPYPVLEAMSCGAIALTTSVGIVPELTRSWENGVILNHESIVEDTVQAITRLSTDPSLASRIRSAAREDVVQRFDWQNVDVPTSLTRIFEAAKVRHTNRSRIDLAARLLISVAVPIKHEIMLRNKK